MSHADDNDGKADPRAMPASATTRSAESIRTIGDLQRQFERERDALVLAGQLSQLGDLSDLQLSVEERQLRVITEQLEYLDTLSKRAEEMINGTTALTDLRPVTLTLNLKSKTGGWQVTTGANVSVIAFGRFT